MTVKKVTGSRKRKRMVLWIILLLLLALYIILVNVLVSAALVPSFMRRLKLFEEITEKGYSEQVQSEDIKENRAEVLSETDEWLETATINKWVQTSEDGYRLVAAEFPAVENAEAEIDPAEGAENSSGQSVSHKWVVLLHGYTGWKEAMYPYAYQYFLRGYNCLVPDLRCQGESEGDFIGMGWTDRKDVLLWIERILDLDPDAEIVLHGQSMGAACALMVSGMEELPSAVKVVISDCAYTDAYSMFRQDIREWLHLPAFPLVDSANLALQVRGGYDLKKASALNAVKKSEIPILFIHGDQDAMIPVSMAYELYDAAGCEKQLLIVEGAGHAQSSEKEPELYWNTVFSFVESTEIF